jgi:hypothetical protein
VFSASLGAAQRRFVRELNEQEKLAMSNKLRAYAFGISLVLLSPLTALAEEPVAEASAASKTENYSYEFEDDGLLGESASALGTVMKVRQGATRTMLLRPRWHFIPELLKSAESI